MNKNILAIHIRFKKGVIMLVLLFSLVLFLPCHSVIQQFVGYNGIPWGSDLDSLRRIKDFVQEDPDISMFLEEFTIKKAFDDFSLRILGLESSTMVNSIIGEYAKTDKCEYYFLDNKLIIVNVTSHNLEYDDYDEYFKSYSTKYKFTKTKTISGKRYKGEIANQVPNKATVATFEKEDALIFLVKELDPQYLYNYESRKHFLQYIGKRAYAYYVSKSAYKNLQISIKNERKTKQLEEQQIKKMRLKESFNKLP